MYGNAFTIDDNSNVILYDDCGDDDDKPMTIQAAKQ